MSDYTQVDIGAGYNSASSINTENTKVETAVNSKLDKSGSTMTGNLDMNSSRIINLQDAVDLQEPVTLNQISGGVIVEPGSVRIEQGVMLWVDVIDYVDNSITRGSDGELYQAQQATTNNDPISDGGTNWLPYLSLDSKVDVAKGIEDWSAAVSYANNAYTRGSDGAVYKSVDATTNDDPVGDDGTNWGYSGMSGVVYATEYGPLQADLEEALADSLTRATWLDCGGKEYEIGVDFIMPAGSRMRNFRLKYTANVAFRGDAACEIEDGFIEGDGIADYGIREVIGTGNGWLQGRMARIIIQGCLINDINLGSFHWLLRMERVRCQSSGLSGYGIHIDNFSQIPNPDIHMNNVFVNGGGTGAGGLNLEDGSFHLNSMSADNVTTPMRLVNAIVTANNCGFEEFTSTCTLSASQLYMNQCTMITKDESFADDSGQRAMITSAGGTIKGSVSLNGGTYINHSVDDVYLIRGNSITPPEFLKIGKDVQKSNVGGSGGEILDFIYQSTGSPAVSITRLTYLGETKSLTTWGSVDPTGSTVFPIENAPNSVHQHIHSDCIARHIYWRESGTNTAGATTEIDFVIMRENNSTRKTVSGIISIPGITSGLAQRFGSAILDEPLEAGEFVKFIVSTAGQRIGSGFDITLVIDE